ncbi:MAG: Phenylalanine-tRNA ligase alpha subunit [Candidatus Wolfebacteria bacterium GW2011_GWC2_39_22]|uniref:Phenylalanine--tRNA ligase alpha subunit n=1 Tax=Candidatus Wolfebacteria bacterium GW2011_GWC2_39_22 TaxID=1619013 RepID=A0A0G0N9J5_9BACT|nr:MAG: Phenylalanine-tRNA ligase alpha subunit [Candidatus Wolfebacteria bacterium GW2011_GWC2_39_22]HBI25489.1 phenylalanine--tRNA ligase subunit alpha [Candidatus Wolfebacteria bacterium]
MVDKLSSIKASFEADVQLVTNLEQWEALRVKYLGRKSQLSDAMSLLKDLSGDQRRDFGKHANEVRTFLEVVLEDTRIALEAKGTHANRIDVTRPGTKKQTGHLHPLTRVEDEIKQIFLAMNFSVVEGPEIETEHYNFDALNVPANHPAREMWDTFWIKGEQGKQKRKTGPTEALRYLLRTHTSPMQIRYMEKNTPPFQIIVPGRVFRYEATDASHEINFYQMEGLMVGPHISLANFKYVIEEFFKKFFNDPTMQFRFRPSYFPFVEPGVEVDIKRKGDSKWLEVMGAGMVHRNVLKAVGYNPEEVQGFAFGMGTDRLAMLKYKIPDIRLLYSGDIRFIQQFKK